MERLTAEDLLMLWPDAIWPQDIGAIATLEAAPLLDAGGRVRIEAVRRAIEAKLHLVPRFRQLMHVPRRGLGRPLWVDARSFDLDDHVRVAPTPVPAPGDEAAMLRTIEQLRSRRLDRSRPLWEMWLLPGLAHDRIGLFVRLHHVIADGIAGVATIGTLLDPTPTAPVAPVPPWRPAPPPTTWDLCRDNLRQRADSLSTLSGPVTTVRRLRAAWSSMRDTFAEVPTPATSLDRQVGLARNLALVRSDLDQVKHIAHAHDAKVNDVLLAATTAGLRALLRSRGEPVDGLILPAFVPVTLRPTHLRDHAKGNLVGQMIVPLPLGVPDPAARLRAIATATAERKVGTRPSLGGVLRTRVARLALLKIVERYPVSVTTSDVPGPPRPAYLAGARLLEVFPLLSLVARVSLGVAALSYAGQFNLTAIADADAHPDLDVFAAAAQQELQLLAAGAAAVPARR